MNSHTPPNSQKDCESIVYSHLKKGLAPCQIYQNGILTKSQTYYAVSKLKKRGLKMVSPGVWQFTNTHHVGKPHTPLIHKKVRAHGITATLKIKNLKGWNDRVPKLQKSGISYKSIPQGQKIIVDNVKTWLTDKSIVFYLPYSWFDETARKAAQKAMSYLLNLIGGLEKRLKVSSFKINGFYHIKFTRQHYALVKNELARQYNNDKKKLIVYDEKGLWLLIDNSMNLHELETLHPKTAQYDNERVQESFNAIKEGFTNRFLAESINAVTQNQEMFAKNIESHIGAIKDLSEGVIALRNEVKRLRK